MSNQRALMAAFGSIVVRDRKSWRIQEFCTGGRGFEDGLAQRRRGNCRSSNSTMATRAPAGGEALRVENLGWVWRGQREKARQGPARRQGFGQRG